LHESRKAEGLVGLVAPQTLAQENTNWAKKKTVQENPKSHRCSAAHPKIEANPRTFSEKKTSRNSQRRKRPHFAQKERNKRSSDVRCVTIVVIEKKVVKKHDRQSNCESFGEEEDCREELLVVVTDC